MSGDDSAAAAGPPRVSSGFLLVQTTTDSRGEAVELARGAVERTEEWVLTLKLPASGYQPLADFLAHSHSYDEPEIVATPIVAGSEPYLSWIEEETRRP